MDTWTLNSFLIAVILFTISRWAACSKADSFQAETISANLRSWNEIYRRFKKFSHCDDGAIAEGYSESVSQKLVYHWDKLGELEKLIKADRKFKKFVLRHIDQSISEENSKKI